MKTILCSLLSILASHYLWSREEVNFQAEVPLSYLQPQEMQKALGQVLPGDLLVIADQKGLKISTENLEKLIDALQLVSALDSPQINIPTYWFPLHYADCETVTASLTERFKKDENGPHLTPDSRTNRIFLIGTVAHKELIAKLIQEADLRARKDTKKIKSQ